MIRRREFIAGLGSAMAWPTVARAQQPAMPVVGMLSGSSFESFADRMAAFRQGLRDIGFIEGRNVAIEYRSARSVRACTGISGRSRSPGWR
jgi:putative ABC transport system substrate-binding protein